MPEPVRKLVRLTGMGLGGRGEIAPRTGIRLAPDRNEEERAGAVVNILKANAGEASMMARCASKARLHNIEPEDLRSMIRSHCRRHRHPACGDTGGVARELHHFAAADAPTALNLLSQISAAAPPRG